MKAASVQLPRPFRPLLWLRNVLLIVVLLFVLTGAGVIAHALWLTHVDTRPGTASVIVVLGGGVLQDGTPGPDTRDRLNHGITLYEEGLAPRMHFTGGHGNPNLPGLGSAMAEVAIAAGVPAEAITVEDASRSTLQNALLSRAPLPPEEAGPVILVSDGYHLGRGLGLVPLGRLSPGGGLRRHGLRQGSFRAQARRVGRESLAWSFNVGRLGVWLTLNALGYEQSDTSDLLAGEPHAMILSA